MDKEQLSEMAQQIGKNLGAAVHTPYEVTTGRQPDFEVDYILDIDPALRDVKPSQGMRCDFLYEDDDPNFGCIYMIWPEILDNIGNVLTDKSMAVEPQGRAFMWIFHDELRETIHKERIKVGTSGYWVIGSKKLAKVTVTKILGLHQMKG